MRSLFEEFRTCADSKCVLSAWKIVDKNKGLEASEFSSFLQWLECYDSL